jgi:DNA-binding response OmpR family regulator
MDSITYRDLEINQNRKTCYVGGSEVFLTKKEYELLKYFMEHPDYVYSRKELTSELWSEKSNDRVIDITISRLRKKIPKYSKNLKTRVGFGYYFDSEN